MARGSETTRTTRWWPLGVAVTLLATAAWSLLTAWSALWASHPAGWTMLVTVGIGATAMAVWSLRSTPRERSVALVAAMRVGLVVAGGALAVAVWWLRPLSADDVAVDALDRGGPTVTIDDTATRLRFLPDQPSGAGLVFYPGAKVDPRAYTRLLLPLAEAGHTVVVVKAPWNLAILSIGAAGDDVGDSGDAVTSWAVGGHSLGGVAAASFAGTPRDELDGLLLWASFPANDLSARDDLDVLSISGSQDGLSTPDDITASRADLPATARFVEVVGAIHAFFGDYGEQSGDGTATVGREEAQAEILTATLALLDRLAGR